MCLLVDVKVIGSVEVGGGGGLSPAHLHKRHKKKITSSHLLFKTSITTKEQTEWWSVKDSRGKQHEEYGYMSVCGQSNVITCAEYLIKNMMIYMLLLPPLLWLQVFYPAEEPDSHIYTFFFTRRSCRLQFMDLGAVQKLYGTQWKFVK